MHGLQQRRGDHRLSCRSSKGKVSFPAGRLSCHSQQFPVWRQEWYKFQQIGRSIIHSENWCKIIPNSQCTQYPSKAATVQASTRLVVVSSHYYGGDDDEADNDDEGGGGWVVAGHVCVRVRLLAAQSRHFARQASPPPLFFNPPQLFSPCPIYILCLFIDSRIVRDRPELSILYATHSFRHQSSSSSSSSTQQKN